MQAKVIMDLSEYNDLKRQADELNRILFDISYSVTIDVAGENDITYNVDLKKLEPIIQRYGAYYKDGYDWIEDTSIINVNFIME